jgi:hypothetical protein
VAFWHRERTVLVMWEHLCDHSPVWSRGDDLDVGPIDVRSLGASEALRDDLAGWNRRCETAADPNDSLPEPTPPHEWRTLLGESFPLAARLQRELGDAWTVWCLSGGGDGGMREPSEFALERSGSGLPVLLRSSGPVGWSPTRAVPALGRFDAGLRRDLHAWRGAADRLVPAEHRAQALELCARMHAALPAGRVLWFGGADV